MPAVLARGRRGAVAGCAKELCYAEIAGSGKEALNIVTKPRGLPLPSPHFLDQPSPSMFVNGLQSSSVNIFLMTSSLLLLSKLPCICLSLIKVI